MVLLTEKKLPTQEILQKALDGKRITPEEAYTLYMEGDFLEMQYVAREIRNRFNKPGIASYTAFRVVNYTNYCNVECSFCSFMDEINSNQGYVLTKDQVLKKNGRSDFYWCSTDVFSGWGVSRNSL